MSGRSILVFACVAACAHPLPPLRVAPLRMESKDGAYRAYVEMLVAGKPISMALDTGATQSILPGRFARAAGLRSPTFGTEIVDANGQVGMMFPLYDVPVRFGSETAAGKMDFLMTDSLDEGLLAPQGLVASGWALTIDLDRGELRYDPEEAALQRLRERGSTPHEVDFHRCLVEGLFNKSHRVVQTTINGVSSGMVIDSGASRTTLARNNSALPSMLKKQGGQKTVVGVNSQGRSLLVEDIPFTFADASFKVSAYVLPASQICGEGLIGADVLHRCTLVWGSSRLWASCRKE